jgi:hypothetical protein
MADDALLPDVTETILEPRVTRVQLGPPEAVPQLFTFTGEDVLELTSWCGAANVTIALQGRVRRPNGQVQVFQNTFTTNATRTATTNVYTIPDGDLLNVFLICATGSPVLNQVFVVLRVRRGAGGAFTRLGTLIQGPITGNIGRAWPGSPVVSVFDAPAAPRLIVGTTPGAGVAVLETVPTGALWQLVAFHVPLTFVAGVIIGAKPPLVIKDASANQIGAYQTGNDFAANASGSFTFAAGYSPPTTTNQNPAGSLPNGLILSGGFTLNMVALGAGVANYGAPKYSVLEWLDI